MNFFRLPNMLQIERLLRRALAELRFTFSAARALLGPILRLVIVWGLGAVINHWVGEGAPAWLDACYDSYGLLMGELPNQLPHHPLAAMMVYIQPTLGILFLAEGVIKLGFEVFNKEANAEEWMQILAQSSRGHVVLCGLGTVGFRTLEELVSLKEQVFVVERKADNTFLSQAQALGAHVVIGDARTENLIRSLNVVQARAVVIVTDDDLANMEIAMDVREMAPHIPIVMRLYDQKLANKVKLTLGVQVSVSTSKLAAPLLASAALDPAVVGTHRVGDSLLLVVEIQLNPQTVLSGCAVGDFQRLHQMTVVALRRGAGPWWPQPEATVQVMAGDRVQLMLPSERVAVLHRLNTPA